jgi:hypothetical protein
VPPPNGRTLEVGCGEGRVTRDLAARGHRVTALDASPTLLRAAAERDPNGEYVLGTAEALPFVDATFALVVAYNVLIDVDDMPAAVREAARVLAPGGALAICVPHPMADAGTWAHDGDDAPFVIEGDYLRARPVSVSIERDGLEMTFDGMTFPLEGYARALEAAGLAIDAIREPPRQATSGIAPSETAGPAGAGSRCSSWCARASRRTDRFSAGGGRTATVVLSRSPHAAPRATLGRWRRPARACTSSAAGSPGASGCASSRASWGR